ncbi:ABC transporter ATP-binding protein [Blastochloris viridis]|uniref:Putrescine transport ATP-binding protein PotA n=1 Tax=Blastochloris viridis TaxID=1079 RepID=A0A0H5BF71_BLAVI|nr:ABC transporter ATP-binding protein [Blastochloris viridis]ALK10316.1 Spermidine/putrescine import ATP-binding protein PotA [Blastochloris viridis]BAR99749.1 putrescine transport ATP-binding protein PotA [Blastochloris viridis]CUU42978.1 Spermidine/putrescine import ATP-binding proteinPotA [Blastochloris viridis]
MSVTLQDVCFRYAGSGVGVSAISLAIAPGELLALIGPSGCGKTTVLKLIAGFLVPDRGRVLLAGQDATHLPTRARDLGIVFQSYALFPHMSALDNVAYPLKVRGLAAALRRRRALEALDMVGLAGEASRRPAALSGGQQQRVALARALVFRPKALLLDEPLSALDAARRCEMRDEIRRLQRAHGIAALHITHDQEEALSMADRVAVMGRGRILQLGTPTEVYRHPANRTVAAFVGGANLWDGRVAGPAAVDTALGRVVTRPHGFAAGAAVAVLVRPERFRAGEGPDGINTFRGTVERDRFLGSVRRFDLKVGSTTLSVETADDTPASSVHVPPDAVQVIVAESDCNGG